MKTKIEINGLTVEITPINNTFNGLLAYAEVPAELLKGWAEAPTEPIIFEIFKNKAVRYYPLSWYTEAIEMGIGSPEDAEGEFAYDEASEIEKLIINTVINDQ